MAVSTALIEAEVNVRVRNYRGLPRSAPATSPYFDTEPHRTNDDQYSIAFRFRLKRPGPAGAIARKPRRWAESTAAEKGGVSAADLQWGNDFDHPIRDRLPPGFNTAMSIVKWWIDPGLEGDAYADAPYLYGPALSSFNAVHVGPGLHDEARGGLWFDEGGRHGLAPAAAARPTAAPRRAQTRPRPRMAWALRPEAKRSWLWEYGRTYGVDFYNAYLDFDRLALRLPGYSMPVHQVLGWPGSTVRIHSPSSSRPTPSPLPPSTLALQIPRHMLLAPSNLCRPF